MFYTFNQNNSGGSFIFDKENGITHFVIVEGDSVQDIIARAERIGIYFNGVDDGIDCPCCGDSWDEPWSDDRLDEEPTIYGMTPKQYLVAGDPILWMKPNPEICIHYADGTKEWVE